MAKYSAVFCLLLGLFAISLAHQLPPLDDLSKVDDYIKEITDTIARKLEIDTLPKDAQEDANDIVNVLRDDLFECKAEILKHLSMASFKACVNRETEEAEDKIWTLKESLVPPNSSSSSLVFRLALILFGLISSLL